MNQKKVKKEEPTYAFRPKIAKLSHSKAMKYRSKVTKTKKSKLKLTNAKSTKRTKKQ